MSSLEKTPTNISEKRSTFLRKSSFQKLKCSAIYPFYLAGSKFSKTNLAHLFERVILKSRTSLQIALIVIALPAFKLFSFWMDTFVKLFGINLLLNNKKFATLEQSGRRFLLKIQQFHEDNKEIEAKKEETLASSERLCEKLEECDKTAETKTEEIHKRLQPSAEPKKIQLKPRTQHASKHNGLLSYCVYGGAAFVYLELVLLIIALNMTYTPPGLIFLVCSSAYIGFIVYKVFLKPRTNDTTTTPPLRPTDPEQYKMSRLTTRRYLQFHDKTLSKIKLL